MSEEIKEVIETTPENNAKDELSSILKTLETTEETEVEKTEVDTQKKDYFKKVGNHTFKTEQEYDSWAQKNYGELSRLSGEMKKLEDKLKSNVPVEVKKETEQDIDSLRMRIKAIDFFEDNPDALGYKEEMAAFLRAGKASDDKGRPSLEIAYKKALKADGKDVIEKEEDNKENIKKLMQAGGGDSGRLSEGSYKSNNDLKSIDDFANAALSGRI